MTVSWRFGVVVSLALTAPVGALPLTEYHAQQSDTLDLFVAGSSAQDSALQRLFRLVCEPQTLDVYRAEGVRLFFCRSRSGPAALPGIAAGQKIAFHKSSANGSGGGVGPLIQRTPVNFLNIADVRAEFAKRCPPERRVVHPADGVLAAYVEYDCANPTPDHQVPDAGISDVEPRFFLNAYHLAPDAVDELTVHSANAFIFGVPVNLKLRDALQAARFPKDDPCNPENRHYADLVESGGGERVSRGETERCMPSLARAQIAGMFAGVITGWDQIVNLNGYALAAKSEQTGRVVSPPGVQPPIDDRVYICRRVATSGTQAAYEMFFLNQRCTQDVPSFVDATPNVFSGSVTSDVVSCLTQLDQRNVWAVGILTTESVESVKDDHWRFIKMDGVAPTLLNTYNGRWPFFVEQSYQWRNEHSEQPLKGQKLALMAQIGLQLGNPAIIRDLNRGFRHVWGSAGMMALGTADRAPPPHPTPGKPVDRAVLDEMPILAVRHESNNCSAVVAQYPTAIP
jgi:hypothetical protein